MSGASAISEQNVHALLQVEQSPAPLTSPSTPPYQSVAKPDVKSEVEELAAQVEQAEDEKVELKQEISSLKKKLSQEVEKYNYHMAVVTQVCTSV